MTAETKIKLLWLCGVPAEVQAVALKGQNVGAIAAWSWVTGHLPPPLGVELHIACPVKNIKKTITVEYKGAVFHLFPSLARGAVYTLYRAWMPAFRRIFNEVRPEWVHGWGVESGFGSAARSLAPQRSVIEIQGILADYYPHLKKSAPLCFCMLNERITLAHGCRFIAESEYSARQGQKYTAGSIRVVAQPLREHFIHSQIGVRANRQAVYLGALEDRKGIKDALRAFATGAPPGWKLLCIGKGAPEYEAEIKALICSLGMESRIELCGTLGVGAITELFQQSPVFLLPTYMDTGPNALKEALAMGLWPVCYDNSGPQEFIGRYQYGSLSPTGNISALAETLRKTLTEEPWKQSGRMEQCVKHIRHDLCRDTIWNQLRKCYTDEYWARTDQ